MRNLLIIIMISMLAGVYACSEDPAELIIEPSEPTIAELEAKVIENCYILREAIEAYKEASILYHPYGGDIYPPSVMTDPYDLGITLLEFLPNGELLENPFTGERTEPSTDTVATESGQIGYGVLSLLGANQVYAITGCGEDSLVVLLENMKEVETRVIYDCFLVRNTLQNYIETHNGSYPGFDISVLVAELPGGIELRNNLTMCRTNPILGSLAATAGEICIYYLYSEHLHAGYEITGCGIVAGHTLFEWKTYLGESEVMITYSEDSDFIPFDWLISRFRQYQ